MDILDFIWNDILIGPIMNGLIVIAHAVDDNYGVAIILFTLIVRVVTYPLTLRQLRATRSMQEMQPRMQEIQKKYKDPKRRQEELMKVYREAGFNPLGCLWPLLVQMPIWIALYQVLRRTLGDTPEQLLRLSSDLYDWAYITSAIPINRDFLFWDLGSSSLEQSLPLAIMVGATAYIQQKVSTARMGPRDERSESMNRTMLWMMPFMFGFFTLQVPAGLGLYWLVTSIFTILTSYYYYFYRQGLKWS
ncbi:MAG: YidC/Oxa1 family membrane protein insertase, partial [Chloroflexi bacterium]|nr:YidC/Oxa1 family membrane protein insertase [Chloroflexota bacterium]